MDVKLISGRMLQYVMKDVIIIVHKSYFWKHCVVFFVWNTLLLSPISIFVGKKYFPTLTFVWCCFVMQLNRRRFVFYPAALFWYFTVLFCTCCRCHSSCCLFWYLQKKNPIAFAAGERFVVWNQHCTRLRSDICVKTKENQIWNAADDRIKRRNWGESLYGFLPVWQKEGEERDAGRRERRRNNNDEQASEREKDWTLPSQISLSAVWEENSIADVEKITRPDGWPFSWLQARAAVSLRVRIVSHMLDAITSPPQRSIWMHRGVWKKRRWRIVILILSPSQSGRPRPRAMRAGVGGADALKSPDNFGTHVWNSNSWRVLQRRRENEK